MKEREGQIYEARVEDLSDVHVEDLALRSDEEFEQLRERVADSRFYNGDLAPAPPSRRTWTTWNIAAMWIGMSVVITTYTLASGLMVAGMNWWQALLTISLGNVLVLIPMVLNAHAGTRYGIPFPVFLRASFGVRGANLPAIARALVACGWFGIQTWLGGLALHTLMNEIWAGWGDITGSRFIAFFVFWLIQVAIILRGIEGIRILESFAAPVLLAGGVVLMIWAFLEVGSITRVFTESARLQGEQQTSFWTLFWPSLAANVGYWATLSLNIPDFTRFAQSQRSQIVGQALGLPLTMTAFSFIGIAVTAATVVLYGEPIWNPVELLAEIGTAGVIVLAMIVIAIAQISTNMAANVVAPSNDFSNLVPRRISFKMGGIITAIIGVISFPWLLYENAGAYIFTWLVGYGSLLGAIGGVMIADYWLLRRQRLELAELYDPSGRYWYRSGFNARALVAVAVAVLPVVPGFLTAATTPGGVVQEPTILDRLYTYGFGFTFVVAFVVYLALMLLREREEPLRAREPVPEA